MPLASTVATVLSLLLHVPPVPVVVKVRLLPAQIVVPELAVMLPATGAGRTVSERVTNVVHPKILVAL